MENGKWTCDRRRGLALLAGATASLLAPGAAEASGAWPGSAWVSKAPAQVGVGAFRLDQAIAYAKRFGGSGIVVRNGYRIASWGGQATRYDLKSATKSFGSILLGLAVADGRLDLTDRAQPRLHGFGLPPASNAATGWLDDVAVRHLATHTAGFEKTGGFGRLRFKPGAGWSYSDGGANWLADLVTVEYGRDLDAVLRDRVLRPLGIPTSGLTWRTNRYRPKTLSGIARREFGSGIGASVDAMARIGLMMARGGRWGARRILPSSYVRMAGTTPWWLKSVPLRDDPAVYPAAQHRYGLLWWNNAGGAIDGLPRDAFWAWGLGEQLILAVPSRDLVAARAGPAMGTRGGFGDTRALQPFFGPLGQADVG